MSGSALSWRYEETASPFLGEYLEDAEEFCVSDVDDDSEELASKPARRSVSAKPAVSTQSCAKLAKRDQLVLDNLALVKSIALRVHENLPVHVDTDDLVHAGVLGLFDAASRFDPEKQVSFASYAKHRVKGAILDSLRQLDWASRDLRRRHKQLEAATRELAAELQRTPTEAEIAERLGVDVDKWRQMMIDLRNTGLISANTRSTDHDDLPEPEYAGTPESQPDNMCAREQMKTALGSAMTVLPDRYRQVVVMYYTQEMTMKEIGTVLGINESRVSQIHKSALEKMQAALQETGIHSSAAF
ncbi:MAG: FliA/WhiG family RNA polymerase sigma factor [Bryobacteraceae bacterium]|nr:FliA/WhiG family RNA polymerase sigma factor [Bryobacteraceae bacterium]